MGSFLTSQDVSAFAAKCCSVARNYPHKVRIGADVIQLHKAT